jgi:hypothetical protein
LETIGWRSYKIPLSDGGVQEFVYFPDCSAGCKMEISISTFDGYLNNNIPEISISYQVNNSFIDP